MNILAIDTATELCSVALQAGARLFSREQLDPTGHSKLVLQMVESIFNESKLQLQDIDLIATDHGPGSFTGMRIGIGVAQGLAYAANKPVVGISSLTALAAKLEANEGDVVLAAIDARMGQVYWGSFVLQAGVPQPFGDFCVSQPDQVSCESSAVMGVGSGWDVYHQELTTALAGACSWQAKAFPSAREVVTLASHSSQENWLDAASLTPVYLRNQVAAISNKSLL